MPETIYDALRESHEIQRSLCRKLLRAKPGTQDRISLFKQLHTELAAHAAAEERFLYAPVLMHDAGLDSSRHALHEHHEMDDLVEDMHKADAEGSGWRGPEAVGKSAPPCERKKKILQVRQGAGRQAEVWRQEVPQGLRKVLAKTARRVDRPETESPRCGAFVCRWQGQD